MTAPNADYACQRCPLPPVDEQETGADFECPRCGTVWTFRAVDDGEFDFEEMPNDSSGAPS